MKPRWMRKLHAWAKAAFKAEAKGQSPPVRPDIAKKPEK